MRSGTIAFFLGILLLHYLPELPSSFWALFLPVAVLGAAFLPGMRLPALFAVGFLWALFRADQLLATSLPPALEGRDLFLEATVASIPQSIGRGVRFEAHVHSLTYAGRPREGPARVRLNWYGDPPALTVGERWLLTVRLKQPHGFSNPGGFDYEGWLFRHGIRASGYVRSRGENRKLAETHGYPVARLRQYLDSLFNTAFENHDYGGIVKALAIGLRHDLKDEHWRVLRTTGTTHLMAISGLHIGLVAGFTFLLARRIWSGLGSAPLYLAAPRFAALPALLAALVYASLAGFSIPTQRALIMVAVVMVATFLRSKPFPSHSLALALFLILILDPLAVLSAGFWLSFAAVAIILFGMSGRLSGQGFWWRWGRVHWLVAVGLLPLLLAFFGENPLLSPLANLVAVPWMGIIVVPLVLVGSLLLIPLPALGKWLLLAGLEAVELIWPFLEWLADLDLVYRIPPVTNPMILAAGTVGVVLLLSPKGFPGRWLGILWLTPLVFVPAGRGPVDGEAWFTLLDVGQGLSAVVRTRDHVLVYDTGPRYSARFDAGHAVVAPFLGSQGIGPIDALVISHNDNDHAGGAESLLAANPTSRILVSEPDARWPLAEHCRRGRRWQWDGVGFQFLHPGADSSGKDNNNSCVLQVTVGETSLLLPGDIESAPERELVALSGAELRSDILVAPHHGSLTSSSEEFLAAVRPEHVLFSIGYRNRFGFPKEKVLARYREIGAATHDTAGHGSITFVLGGDSELGPRYHREEEERFWHHR